MAPPVRSVEERFLAGIGSDQEGGCIPWLGALNREGYGRLMVDGRSAAVHRVAYELGVGPIPEGMALDHTCHSPDECRLGRECPHRACVNPEHLEPVTLKENNHRGRGSRSACLHGHLYTESNTAFDAAGHRVCRECQRLRGRAYRLRQAGINVTDQGAEARKGGE